MEDVKKVNQKFSSLSFVIAVYCSSSLSMYGPPCFPLSSLTFISKLNLLFQDLLLSLKLSMPLSVLFFQNKLYL